MPQLFKSPHRLFIAVIFATLPAAQIEADDPILIAHRGLLRHAPENTLPAFAACLELGIGFELDIRTTQDGHLVVLHDDSVGRTTSGGDRSIRNVTLGEAQKLDAGRWFSPDFSGVRIPTLEETLALVKQRRRGRTSIALNVKHLTQKGEQTLVSLVAKYELLDDSFAFDQSDDVSRRLKKRNPKFRIGQNVNRQNLDTRLKENLLDVFLLTFVPTAEEVARLHKHGKQVLYNFAGPGDARRNPKVWNTARDVGIDGMLTDFPLECRNVWRQTAASQPRKSAELAQPPLDVRGTWVETPWGQPVIDRGVAGSWDHYAVDNPYVYVEAGTWYCFFEAQDKSFNQGGHERVGLAVSEDGVHWKKLANNPILDVGEPGAWDSVVAKLPASVIKRDGLYHMFYSGLDKRTKQIGIATARKLAGPWTKSRDNPVLKSRAGKWDAFLSTYPAPLFTIGDNYYLLFRGMKSRYRKQGAGLAVSSDFRHWRRVSDAPVIPTTEEVASLAVAETERRFVGISQPMDLSQRRYWTTSDLRAWEKGPPVKFRASVQAETLSNPFLVNGQWTVLYEQKDRIYRAVLSPSAYSNKQVKVDQTRKALDRKVQPVIDELDQLCRKKIIYMIGPTKAKRLAELVREKKPRVVVECGTAVGYSGLWIARELKAAGRGKLITIEIDEDRAKQAKANFEKAGLADVIEVRVGDARQLTSEIKGPVDFLFIDCNFSNYGPCFRGIEKQLAPGAVIVADNVGVGAAAMKDYLDVVRTKYQSRTESFEIDLPWGKRDAMEITIIKQKDEGK